MNFYLSEVTRWCAEYKRFYIFLVKKLNFIIPLQVSIGKFLKKCHLYKYQSVTAVTQFLAAGLRVCLYMYRFWPTPNLEFKCIYRDISNLHCAVLCTMSWVRMLSPRNIVLYLMTPEQCCVDTLGYTPKFKKKYFSQTVTGCFWLNLTPENNKNIMQWGFNRKVKLSGDPKYRMLKSYILHRLGYRS